MPVELKANDSILIKQVIKRIELQYSVNQIAESLLEPLDIIQPIYDIALQQGSDYDANLILDELNSKKYSINTEFFLIFYSPL